MAKQFDRKRGSSSSRSSGGKNFSKDKRGGSDKPDYKKRDFKFGSGRDDREKKEDRFSKSREEKPYSDRPKRRDDSGESSFERRERPERRDNEDKRSSRPRGDKPYGDRLKRSNDSGESSFEKRDNEDRRSSKPRGDKPGDRPKRRDDSGESSFERRERPERRDNEDKRSSRPRGDKPYGDRPKRRDDNSGKSWFDKRKSNNESIGDFEDRRERKSGDFEKKEYKKPYGDRKDSERRYEKKKPYKSKSNDSEGTRLNKYIANAGICSRREADELIKAGAVSVNGKIITEMGYKISPTDIINYGGQTLRREKMVYVLLNKPKDYITTADDPEGRKTVLHLVRDACRERIYPVGRLDRATSGVLLFTNDGDLTKKLTHPKHGVKKIYHVGLDKPLAKSDFQKIEEGIELEDGFIKADEVSYVGEGNDKKEIGIVIHSGKNRIIRRIFEHLGYDVKKLDRVVFAGLTKKDLPRGRWRFLTEQEVSILKMMK